MKCFIQPEHDIYLQRGLVPWADSVKLNYSNSPGTGLLYILAKYHHNYFVRSTILTIKTKTIIFVSKIIIIFVDNLNQFKSIMGVNGVLRDVDWC